MTVYKQIGINGEKKLMALGDRTDRHRPRRPCKVRKELISAGRWIHHRVTESTEKTKSRWFHDGARPPKHDFAFLLSVFSVSLW